MFEQKEWEAILIVEVVNPEIYRKWYKDIGKWIPEDGSEKVITVKARTIFGAAMEIVKDMKLRSMCFLGMPIAYKIKPGSIRRLKKPS
jgi:hypothetical protein